MSWLVRLFLLGLLAGAITGCAPAKSVAIDVPEPDYWPTESWRSAPPEAQGMDSERLAQMVEGIAVSGHRLHSLLVVRNGYLVTEAYFHPYTKNTQSHIQSVTKSVVGALVGVTAGEGLIEGEDERLLDYYPNRQFHNPDPAKQDIRLGHLLSMSSGLDCEEFGGGPAMEQTQAWVQTMLDLPMTAAPGEQFGYCNGNAHLLSAVVEKATGMTAREYANQKVFAPLGIPPASEEAWWSDPQEITMAGYGLHLRPEDMARLGFLYLHNGRWDGRQIVPAEWVASSVTQQVEKEDGSGYGYLWTVYPEAGRYAALGLGGQQVHVIPAENLIVVTTADLDAFAEAPEIEALLSESILPAILSDEPLAENPEATARLQAAIERASHPVLPVAVLPATAAAIAGATYSFDENPLLWKTVAFDFQLGAPTARIILNDVPVDIGLDNIFRLSDALPSGDVLLRGRWTDEQTFVLEYPYALDGRTVLGELGESEFRFVFDGDRVQVAAEQLVFGGEPIMLEGQR